jgi:hypothetical protein
VSRCVSCCIRIRGRGVAPLLTGGYEWVTKRSSNLPVPCPVRPDLSGRPDSTSHGLPPSVVSRLVGHLGFAHALGFQGVADDPEG